jgi:hypothetical protein
LTTLIVWISKLSISKDQADACWTIWKVSQIKKEENNV